MTDKQINEIWKSEYSLQEFLAKDKFKSYEELKELLDEVNGDDVFGSSEAKPTSTKKSSNFTKKAEEIDMDDDMDDDEIPFVDNTPSKEDVIEVNVDDDDDDDLMKKFDEI